MRILQLVQKPQRRGAEVFSFHLSAWLRDRAHEVQTVYLYPHDGGNPLETLRSDVVAMGDEHSVLEHATAIHPRLLGRLRRAVMAFMPDIVQTNGARTVKYGAALTLSNRGRRWRLVYRNIDRPAFWVRGRLRESLYRRFVMPRVDGVISVSETTLEEVRAFYRLRAPSIFVPNGVDLRGLTPLEKRTTVRERYQTPQSARVLLFSGNLGPQKRPDRFLRVAAEIGRRSDDDVYAWLLGDGPDLDKCRRLAADLGIADRVRFVGCQADVASVVAACDIHLSPSATEGMPAVAIEAAHLGLPTVAFRVGGMHECVKHGETGLLVTAEDEAALADAALSLVNSPSRRAAMGETARRWVDERFSIDAVGQQYESFYGLILGRAT